MRQEEEKLKKEIKVMAQKNQTSSVKTLAKQVVRSRKSQARLERTKASMQSVQLHLTTSIAQMSTANSLKMSNNMMREMNKLTNVGELAKTMQEMQTEMARAEIADEMMEEAFEESDDEAEIDSEITKVYDELNLNTSRVLASAEPPVASHAPYAG